MTKFLFSLAAAFLSILLSAQQQKISFETSEGYNLGTVVGQKEWTVKTDIPNSNFKVIKGNSTEGTNSVQVTSNGNYTEELSYLFKKIPEYNRISISADVKLEKLDSSDYYMLSLYYNNNGVYSWAGGFFFGYEAEIIADSDEAAKYVGDWIEGKWYNLRMEIDHVTNKDVKYYIDNQLVFTSPLSSKIFRTNELNFEFDNYNSGYIVDNIIIKDMDQLAVNDMSKIQINIFPNPTSDFINIKSDEVINSIKIYDIKGSLIKTENNSDKAFKIDISSFAKGNYIISIETKSGIETKKFIKN
ncbi:T9SS type A sorting domain-containing protein [Epilithonimonas sp. UC225_85]|uniref:T9SS type A sorting domain-containing protein n=1 Tax=Epilithonimonas sp. UC225_85 TaxID=3350167 RepID=UPI0036D23570